MHNIPLDWMAAGLQSLAKKMLPFFAILIQHTQTREKERKYTK